MAQLTIHFKGTQNSSTSVGEKLARKSPKSWPLLLFSNTFCETKLAILHHKYIRRRYSLTSIPKKDI